MFRKGGAVEKGIMKLATGGRAMYADGPGPALDPNDPLVKEAQRRESLLRQFAGAPSDVKQDLYDVLISGGINLAGGVGAGDGTIASIARSFKEPTEKFLAKRPKEETFKKQLGLAAGQAAISADSKKTKQDRLLYLSDLKSQIEQKQASGIKLTPAEENRLKAINIEIFKLDKDPYLKGESPAAMASRLEKEKGLTSIEANNIAKFRTSLPKIDPKIYKLLDSNNPEVSSKEIKVTPQGITFSETITEKSKNKFQPGKAYFNYSDGQLYLYRGNNKFEKLQ